MEIFGFEIKRKDAEDKAPSFVAPINDDGAQVVETGQGGYAIGGGMAQGTFLDMEGGVKSEKDLILRYRQMSLIPEVDMAIDDIVQEAISSNDLDAQVGINLDATKMSDSIKSKVRDEFSEVLRLLRFNQTSSEIFRKWYVDGRMYFHLLVDPKNPKKGIVGLRMIDPIQMKKVREVQKKKDKNGVEIIDKVKEFYTYNQGGFEKNQSYAGQGGQTLMISPDAVVYNTSGMMDANRQNIIGYMHKGLKAANQLRMMEDALVIYRISRAPERRIFYIDVGNLPRREGGRGTEITTLPGGQNLGEIEDIIYFQRKLFRSLNVPISRLETESGFSLGRTTEISRDEVKFSRFVDRLRMKFSSMFFDILRTQLALKGVLPIEEWELEKENIRFDYQKDSHFVEMKDAEILRERVTSLRELDEFVGKYYSQQWIRKNVLRQSEEEIEMIDSQIKDEQDNEDGEGEDDSNFM